MTFSGNPSLRRVVKKSQNGEYATQDGNTVSMKGMAWKSIVFCAVTIIAAVVCAVLLYNFLDTGNESGLTTLIILLSVSAIPLVIISLIIAFVPKTAGVLGFVYCILEGALMGIVSALVDMVFPGVALMAFLGTGVVFMVSWLVFRVLGKKLSGKFVKFVLISFFSLIILEGLVYLLSLIVPAFAVFFGNIWVQLAISAVFILWAAFMVMVDLNNMHLLEESGADKKYEWYAAFSLVTTLMWMYLEILELLMKIAMLAKRD